jgi:hypothetical protein
MIIRIVLCIALAVVTACGSGGPTSPSVPAGRRFLIAGQSNAIGLRDCCMSDAISVVDIASINYWLQSPQFAAAGRNPELIALVWWQGANDIGMSHADYAAKLRHVIAIARAGNPNLPIRIVDLPPLEDRAVIRAAQAEVAQDSNAQLIPSADLALQGDGTGHFSNAAYQEVRARILRSLGM